MCHCFIQHLCTIPLQLSSSNPPHVSMYLLVCLECAPVVLDQQEIPDGHATKPDLRPIKANCSTSTKSLLYHQSRFRMEHPQRKPRCYPVCQLPPVCAVQLRDTCQQQRDRRIFHVVSERSVGAIQRIVAERIAGLLLLLREIGVVEVGVGEAEVGYT